MPEESYWDLLEEVSRLQRELGGDMVAWAQVYEAAGRAMQRNADTAALMAGLGRRSERFLQEGPPAAAQRAFQFFFNPLQALSGAAGGGGPGPLGRLWEAWAATLPGGAGPAGGPGSADSAGPAGGDQKEEMGGERQ